MENKTSSKFSVKISYLEIYNEQVKDLLRPKTTQLLIVEDPMKGVFVPELRECEVELPQQLFSLIE
jgi:hypothetical protein